MPLCWAQAWGGGGESAQMEAGDSEAKTSWSFMGTDPQRAKLGAGGGGRRWSGAGKWWKFSTPCDLRPRGWGSGGWGSWCSTLFWEVGVDSGSKED